jgi:hypothetical protein
MILPSAVHPETLAEASYTLLLLVGAVGLALWAAPRRFQQSADPANDEGQEGKPLLAPWPQSEIAHFYQGIAVMLVLLAGCVTAVGLARHHAAADLLVLGPALVLAVGVGQWLLSAFLATNQLLQ